MHAGLKKKQYFRLSENIPVAGLVVRVLRMMYWSDSLSPLQGGVVIPLVP